MGQDERVEAPLIHSGEWNIHYDYAVGETATRFFSRLRDEGKIAGKRCPECKAVLLPPRAYCERCFVKTEEWVDVGPEGTIEAFTIVYEPFDGLPQPPYAVAYVTLDGASTAMANFVRGLDLSVPEVAARELAVGKRVEAVFIDARKGTITDFHYRLK
ncbi:MAG: Zn-ribbon domain-containing OB-fold protein [Actinomycetota bacterium]|nr:Zn-ribbon domain-containing OB-fold protein [Actinomycetota bacterium]